MSLVMTRFRMQTTSLMEEMDRIRSQHRDATQQEKQRTVELLDNNAKLQQQLAKSLSFMKTLLYD